MPRPAPRVAPATSATRPVSGFEEDLAFFILLRYVAIKLNACLDCVKRDESTTPEGRGRGRVRGIGAGHETPRTRGAHASRDCGGSGGHCGRARAAVRIQARAVARACPLCLRNGRHWCDSPSPACIIAAGGAAIGRLDVCAVGRFATRRPSEYCLSAQRSGGSGAAASSAAAFASRAGMVREATRRRRRRRRAARGYRRWAVGSVDRSHASWVVPLLDSVSRRLCRRVAAPGRGGRASARSGEAQAEREESRAEKMTRTPCVIGVAEHAGWAHLVCVAAAANVPAVVVRRRVTTIDKGLPTMPYHHESLGL